MTRPTAEERVLNAIDFWIGTRHVVDAQECVEAIREAEEHAAAETEALRAQLRIVRRILTMKFEQAAKGARPDTIVLSRQELLLQGFILDEEQPPQPVEPCACHRSPEAVIQNDGHATGCIYSRASYRTGFGDDLDDF